MYGIDIRWDQSSANAICQLNDSSKEIGPGSLASRSVPSFAACVPRIQP